jgi:DNA-directed RNA polymerase specialized sigma24 family protein
MAQIIAARLAGEDYEEICARTKMTPAQAHKLFHRAKQELLACAEGALA